MCWYFLVFLPMTHRSSLNSRWTLTITHFAFLWVNYFETLSWVLYVNLTDGSCLIVATFLIIIEIHCHDNLKSLANLMDILYSASWLENVKQEESAAQTLSLPCTGRAAPTAILPARSLITKLNDSSVIKLISPVYSSSEMTNHRVAVSLRHFCSII